MTKYLHTNNASSNLRSAINAAVTSLQVTAGQGVLFPNPTTGEGFFVTVEDRRTGRLEIMLCTSRTTDTLTVTRGQQGTVPQSFSPGVNVSNRVTAQILNEFVQETVDVIPIARIPPIPDSKLTTVDSVRLFGTINALRLPVIPPGNLTSVPAASLTGTIAAARLPNPLPAANLPDIPSAKLTVVPAANLSGLVPLNNIPTLPNSKIEEVAGSKISGTIPGSAITGSYNNFVNAQGSGDATFNRFYSGVGNGNNPAYAFQGALDAGMGFNPSFLFLGFAGGARLSISNVAIEAIGGTYFKGSAAGLTSVPANALIGSAPSAAIKPAMNANTGTAGMYAPRAWVRVNISGGVATVQDHGNIPTVSAQGGGVFRCLFSQPMANINYCVVATTDVSNAPKVASYNTAYIDIDAGTGSTRLNVLVIQ